MPNVKRREKTMCQRNADALAGLPVDGNVIIYGEIHGSGEYLGRAEVFADGEVNFFLEEEYLDRHLLFWFDNHPYDLEIFDDDDDWLQTVFLIGHPRRLRRAIEDFHAAVAFAAAQLTLDLA